MGPPASIAPILVDIQALQRPETAHRGIGRYVTGLVRAMLDAELPVIGLGLNPALAAPLLPADPRWSSLLCELTAPEVDRRVGGGGLVHLVASPLGVSDVAVDAVFPSWLVRPGVHRVTVVYDLIAYLFPDRYAVTESDRRFLAERRAEILRSDLLLAISRSTRDDLVARWDVDPSRIEVIGAPPAHDFDVSASVPARRSRIGRRFVMAPVGYEWRKEPSTLIEAWSRLDRGLRRRRRLVLVGEAPAEVRDGWVAAARRLGLGRREVVSTGRVDDDELGALYRSAELVVHPSRYEGFGLPVLEAARCGALSVTSDRGALPEVLDCEASTFDPDDPDDIARVVTAALRDEGIRSVLRTASERAVRPPDDGGVAARVACAIGRLRSGPG